VIVGAAFLASLLAPLIARAPKPRPEGVRA